MTQKIGIWGFGIVGKSLIHYLHSQGYELEVFDKRILAPEEKLFLQTHAINYVGQQDSSSFFERNNLIYRSPGIAVEPYRAYIHKFKTEVDLFTDLWYKPLIAITGTIGKTSITHLLSHIIQKSGRTAISGGNIGTPLMDLLIHQEKVSCAVIELSSFQLEYTTTLAPDLAIWTNLYPNHLDRHGTLENYFEAKYNLLAYQKPEQKALIPWQLYKQIIQRTSMHMKSFAIFIDKQPSLYQRAQLRTQDTLYFLHDNTIYKYYQNKTNLLSILKQMPSCSYPINWLILQAAADLLDISLTQIPDLNTLTLPEHRFEIVAKINNITFYNNSKATITQATLAAVMCLHSKPLYLFLGGLCKWITAINPEISVQSFIKQLKPFVKAIFCFGSSAELFYAACQKEHISAYKSTSLDGAFLACTKIIKPGDHVLFSPTGASYDLFKDYQERGEYFKNLVKTWSFEQS